MVERPRVSGEVLGRGSGVRAEGEVQGAKAKGEWVRPKAGAYCGLRFQAKATECAGRAMSRPRARPGAREGLLKGRGLCKGIG